MTYSMPFAGVATFARAPLAPWPAAAVAAAAPGADPPPPRPDPRRAGFAVYGIPFDCAVGYRPGQRLAPRAIRDLSTRLALPWGADNPGYWDVTEDRQYLQGARLIDAGDADPLYFDLEHLHRSVRHTAAAILQRAMVPVALGGDHSVSHPALAALAPLFAAGGPYAGQRLYIVQIDAHLDFSADMGGFAHANSSPFRRAAELPHVGPITLIGLRGLRTQPAAYRDALARGHSIVTAQALHRQGLAAALAALPAGRPVYVSLDIDALDPATAPGTSSPEPGGLTYDQVRDVLQAVADRNEVIGLDVVEVNPYLDPAGLTSLLAARLAIEAMAFIHAAPADHPPRTEA